MIFLMTWHLAALPSLFQECLAIELDTLSLKKISMGASLFVVFSALKYLNRLSFFPLGGKSPLPVFNSSLFLKKRKVGENERSELGQGLLFCVYMLCLSFFFNAKCMIKNKGDDI